MKREDEREKGKQDRERRIWNRRSGKKRNRMRRGKKWKRRTKKEAIQTKQ